MGKKRFDVEKPEVKIPIRSWLNVAHDIKMDLR
jgi:hypothetical protein